jgi:hypothetical protein
VSEQGVPVDEVTAKDFIMVRAALVKRLGGANEALVWSRIEYRTNSAKDAHEADEKLWWAASYEVVADETGLSRDQVKRAVAKLVESGFLLAEKHHGSVQTMSYSPVILHRAESPDGVVPSGEIALSIGRNRPMTGAESPDAPLFKKKEEVKKGGAAIRGTRIATPFIVTKEMREWATARTPLVNVDLATERFVNYWRAKSGANATKLDWPATWRNWLLKDQGDRDQRTVKATPTERAQSVIDMGRQLDEAAALQPDQPAVGS